MKSKKTKVLVIILCLTMVYMTTVYAATGFSENITQTKSIFSLPSNGVKGLISECIVTGNTRTNRVKSSNMDTDTDINGIVDGFTNYADGKVTVINSLNDSAQKIDMTASTGSGSANVSQKIEGFSEGDSVSVRVAAKFTVGTGSPTVRMQMVFYTSADEFISSQEISISASTTGYEEIKLENQSCPATTAKIGIALEIRSSGSGDTGTVWFKNCMLELASSVGNYIKTGTKSTLCGVLQSVGKNLWDGTYENAYIDTGDGSVISANPYRTTMYIRVKPSTQYTIKTIDREGVNYYDINKNLIDFDAAVGSSSRTFTTPVNCAYIRIYYDRYGTDDGKTVQLEYGASAIDFTEHEISEAFYPVELHSTLDGTKCEFDYKTGKHIKRHSKYALQSADIASVDTSPVNVDYVTIEKPTDFKYYNSTDANGTTAIRLGSYGQVSGSADDTSNHWKVSSSANATRFILVVPTGTYADVAAARTDLVTNKNTSPIYQLATPQTTTYNTTPLACYENGTIMVMQQVKESAAYNNGMSISNTNLPIKSLVRVDKIENGVLTPIDLSNATIAPDGLSITISGAVNGETYIYVYEYAPELSTIPTIIYSVPINQDGQITGNTNAIQRHSDLIDIILQQIQLMRQEIQELKTMLQ